MVAAVKDGLDIEFSKMKLATVFNFQANHSMTERLNKNIFHIKTYFYILQLS